MSNEKSPLDVPGVETNITRSEMLNSLAEGRERTSYPKIISVTPLADHWLRVGFADGITKIYDCKPLLCLEIFKPLYDSELFMCVTVSPGGYGVEWSNGEIDLAESELWEKGVDAVDGATDL